MITWPSNNVLRRILYDQLKGSESIIISDCNLGIEFLIPGSGIKKFVIPGSRFWTRLTDWWSSFWHPQSTYFIHRMYSRALRNVYPNYREWQWLSK